MLRLTYWHTSRDAPKPGTVAVVVAIQDTSLHIVMDGPTPTGTHMPPPEVTVTTDKGVALRYRALDGVGTGGIGGRYLWIAVFDLPPEDTEVLRLSARIGDEPELAVWLYRTGTVIE